MKRVREQADHRRPAFLHVRSGLCKLFSEAVQEPPAGQPRPSLRSTSGIAAVISPLYPYSQSSTVRACVPSGRPAIDARPVGGLGGERSRLDGWFARWSIA